MNGQNPSPKAAQEASTVEDKILENKRRIANRNREVESTRSEILHTLVGPVTSDEAIQEAESDDPNVRGMGIHALGRMKSVKGVPVVLKALKDEVAAVRFTAIRALIELRAVEAIESLQLTVFADPDENISLDAVWALEELGTPKAIEALMSIARVRKDYVGLKSVWALERIAPDQSDLQSLKGAILKPRHGRPPRN